MTAFFKVLLICNCELSSALTFECEVFIIFNNFLKILTFESNVFKNFNNDREHIKEKK